MNTELLQQQRRFLHQIRAVPDTGDRGPGCGIYGRNHYGMLYGALADKFPICQQLLGGEAFRMLAFSYIAATPATEVSLELYGLKLAAFLVGHPLLDEIPFLGDIARLEQALHQAQHAPVWHDVLSLSQLQAIIADGGFSRIRWQLDPSVTVIKSKFPIFDIWQYHQGEDHKDLSFGAATHNVIVYRANGSGCLAQLSPVAEYLLNALSGSNTIESPAAGEPSPADEQHSILFEILTKSWVVASASDIS